MLESKLLLEVERFVAEKVAPLTRAAWAQEPGYVAAFLGRMTGRLNLDEGAYVEFKPVPMSDHGRGTAEQEVGSDFSLKIEPVGNTPIKKKAILAQAKNKPVDKLTVSEKARLKGQCEKMAKSTREYIVFERPMKDLVIPTVRIGKYDTLDWESTSIPFHEYLVQHLFACTHGDTDEAFIKDVADSHLRQLRARVYGLKIVPDTKPGTTVRTRPKNI